MRAGLFALNGFFLTSLIVLNFSVGDYNDAVQHARTFDEDETTVK